MYLLLHVRMEDRKSDPASFLIEGMESNNSFTAITEEFVPAFGEPRKPQIISFDNDRNFSTYRITFLNNESDFNGSAAIEIAEIDLLAVPLANEWLEQPPFFHLGGKASFRTLSTAPGSWQFNGGEVNYPPVEPGVATIQVWSRERSSDFNSSRFFLNGTEQDKKETVNPSLFPLDTNPFTSIGAGFTEFGSFLPL